MSPDPLNVAAIGSRSGLVDRQILRSPSVRDPNVLVLVRFLIDVAAGVIWEMSNPPFTVTEDAFARLALPGERWPPLNVSIHREARKIAGHGERSRTQL